MATVALRLIATTDLHAHLRPYDYYRDAPDPRTGLAKAATLIAAARAEAPVSLLIDNGDLIQGSPLGDWAAQAGGSHPMIAAMNALSYDAAALGNHEFNYGLETLDAALGGARFPVLCCNVLTPEGAPRFTPWTILRRRIGADEIAIGLIGFVTPQILRWDMSHLTGRVAAMGIVEAARRYAPACRAAGADIVVALCHAGISRIGPAGEDENAGLTLAQSGEIDALILGHQHLKLPGSDFEGLAGVDAATGQLAGVPAVMPGFWGGHIGVIDLELEKRATGWRVASFRSELRAVEPTTPADPAATAASEDAHRATLDYVRAPVGAVSAPLASYFAMIGDDPSVRIVHDAQLWYARRLAEALPVLREAPLLSAAAPFKCGGRAGPEHYTSVPAGPLALRHVADLYVYPNGLRIVRATGALLREWLERAASVFAKLDPALTGEQPLLRADVAPYDFDSLAGLSYRLDPTQPARYDDQGQLADPSARRVLDLSHEGRPLDDSAPFLVVTNSYRAGGGGHFPGLDGSNVIYDAPDSNFDALLQYVRAHEVVAPTPGGAWRLKPWPATVVATLPAPAAAADFPPPPGVSVASLGPGLEGFLRFRVTPE